MARKLARGLWARKHSGWCRTFDALSVAVHYGAVSDVRWRPSELLATLVGISILAVVTYAFVGAERFIYFWDFSGYWVATIRLGDLLETPLAAAEAVAQTVRHQKYNLLAAIPLAPISRMLDYDRTAWVLTVLFVYGLPATLALVALAARLGDGRRDAVSASCVVLVVVLMPALWAPMLRGSVGIGGVALAVVLWLAFDRPLREISVRRAVAAGVLLTCLVLFRRWYAFWAIGWLAALGVEALVQSRARDERRSAVLSVGVVAASAAVTLFVLATPIAVKMVTTDPAADRAAYRVANFYFDGLARVVGHFGLLPVLLAVGGLVLCLREPRTRRLARILAVQTVVVLLLFLRTQRFDRHHYYLLAPQVAVLGGTYLTFLARRARESVPVRLATVGCILAALVGFGAAFSGAIAERVGSSWVLFGSPRYQPYTRGDLSEVVRLSRALDRRTRESGAKIYVLSSYVLMNEDVLKHAHHTTDAPDLSDRVLLSAHLDLREPFPGRLFQADFVVVTDPVRLHLPPEEQEVISVPAAQILSGEGIGRSYRRLHPTFRLEDGTEVGIWKRIAPVRPAQRDQLRRLLDDG